MTRIPVAVALMLVLAGMPARAMEKGTPGTGDAEAAKPLIASQCVKCHVVPGFPADQVQPAAGAPSFSEIAANPARYTDARLAAFLRQPHYPMKGFVLSRKDIANILAYIHALRAGR